MVDGPLDGLRVVDLTDDSGRFATKLLAEGGANVVRLGTGGAGPSMASAAAATRGGLLDWWYDGGKSRVAIDLDTDDGRAAYRRLGEAADLIIETELPGRLEALGSITSSSSRSTRIWCRSRSPRSVARGRARTGRRATS